MRPDILFLFAPSGQGGGATTMVFLFQMAAIIAIFYFLLIRPKVQQEKRHRERLAQIKRGDKIVTAGGIVGEVLHIKDAQLTVKSGESRLVVQRERVADILGDESEGESK
ncbi:MAG: preprotein translocase subunit YajC [Gemmatimonadales bacterium]